MPAQIKRDDDPMSAVSLSCPTALRTPPVYPFDRAVCAFMRHQPSALIGMAHELGTALRHADGCARFAAAGWKVFFHCVTFRRGGL
jgi:hypothetical protein